MSKMKTKVLSGAFFTIILCIGLQLNTEKVKADAVVTTQQGVVLKSANLVTSKTIKVPQKEVQTVKGTESNKNTKSSYSRGFSGGSAIASGSTNNVVSKAFQFLGTPYIYGASGPKAFDCSGFTAYVYSAFGISLPHYSVAQAQIGKAVSRGSLQPGDLVFFNTDSYLSHVGIYIGNGQIIHASSGSGKVTVSELGSSYYSTRYAGARRILK